MIEIVSGSVNQHVDVFIQDSSSDSGAGLTGLVYNSAGLTCYYRRGQAGSWVGLTLATQTVGGAHVDGGFVETDATNAPGWYRLDLPDAAVANLSDGTNHIHLHLQGATNMVNTPVTIKLVPDQFSMETQLTSTEAQLSRLLAAAKPKTVDEEYLKLPPYTFTRDIETVNYDGTICPPNSPRREREHAVAGKCEWVSTGLDYGTGDILAVGVGHDNVTTLMLLNDTAANMTEVWEDDGTGNYVQRSTLTWSGIDEILGTGGTFTYAPTAGLVWNGMLVLALERSSAGVIVGATFIVSQDKGVTWAYVNGVGLGHGDLAGPAYESAPAGLFASWSVGAFPVKGVEDLKNVRFAIVDYQAKAATPGGGQAFVWEATRATTTGLWTVDEIRTVVTREEAAENGLHAHTCFPVSVGLVVVWGDVDYRNHYSLHSFDWSLYKTDTITENLTWAGANDDVYTAHDQGVGACPHPDGGALLSADVEYGLVYWVKDVRDANGVLQTEYMDTCLDHTRSGASQAGFTPLHGRFITTATGPIWTFGGSERVYHISRDGRNIARMHAWDTTASSNQRIYSDGKFLFMSRNSDSVIFRSKIPAIKKIRPLKLYPSGTNFARDDDWTHDGTGPTGTNTVRKLNWNGRKWTYDDDGSDVGGNLPAPPSYGQTYEMDFKDAATAGHWQIAKTTGQFSVQGGPLLGLYSLDDDWGIGVEITPQLRGTTLDPGTVTFIAVEEKSKWFMCEWMDNDDDWNLPAEAATDYGQIDPLCRLGSGNNSYPEKIAVHCYGWVSGTNMPTYPLAEQTLTDPGIPEHVEVEIQTDTSGAWTCVLGFRMPMDFRIPITSTAANYPAALFRLKEDATNYVEFKIDQISGQRKVQAVVVENGSTAQTITHDITLGDNQPFLMGGPVYIILTSDGTMRISDMRFNATETGSAINVSPTQLVSQDVHALDLFWFDSVDYAQTTAQQNDTLFFLDIKGPETEVVLKDGSLTDAKFAATGEPGPGAPPSTLTLPERMRYWYKNWRNKKRQTSSLFELYNDAGDTVDQKAIVSDSLGVVTKEEMEAGP